MPFGCINHDPQARKSVAAFRWSFSGEQFRPFRVRGMPARIGNPLRIMLVRGLRLRRSPVAELRWYWHHRYRQGHLLYSHGSQPMRSTVGPTPDNGLARRHPQQCGPDRRQHRDPALRGIGMAWKNHRHDTLLAGFGFIRDGRPHSDDVCTHRSVADEYCSLQFAKQHLIPIRNPGAYCQYEIA